MCNEDIKNLSFDENTVKDTLLLPPQTLNFFRIFDGGGNNLSKLDSYKF